MCAVRMCRVTLAARSGDGCTRQARDGRIRQGYRRDDDDDAAVRKIRGRTARTSAR